MKHALLLLSLIAAQGQAQIIYTDVIPDALYDVSGDTCRLDLNNDGITDFYIRYYKHPSGGCMGCNGNPNLHPSWVRLDALGTNAVDTVINLDAPYAGVRELLPLTVIDASLNWIGSNDWVLANISTYCSGICVPHNGDHGPWADGASSGSPRFLGLRFSSGGSTYYGWARLSIPFVSPVITIPSVTLKDYAYNSVPDEFILAGDTGVQISTGIARFAHPDVQVTPNPFTSTVSISIGAAKPGILICTVRSLTGQALVTRSIAGSVGRSSFDLDLASLAPGVYMLDVVINGERIVRKVMRE